jgi:hypothetical protein
MVGDRTVDIAFLHHFPAPRVFREHSVHRGSFDARRGSETHRWEIEGTRADG